MPLVHISLREGKPPAYRRAIADGVYEAMLATINVPSSDRFQLISEHSPDGLRFHGRQRGGDFGTRASRFSSSSRVKPPLRRYEARDFLTMRLNAGLSLTRNDSRSLSRTLTITATAFPPRVRTNGPCDSSAACR